MIKTEKVNGDNKSGKLVISLFFLWALTANLLPVLIPHLKKAANVSILQASLVDSAYWIAYFLLAIPAGLVMRRFGYKTAIISGLLMASVGAFLFPFAADARSFYFFLLALFIVASGMTFLETSANPYIRELGTIESYPRRLNFAQAFNGMGAVVATNILNQLILPSKLVKSKEELNVMGPGELDHYYGALFGSIKLPYIIIGIVLVVFAFFFLFDKTNVRTVKNSHGRSLFNPFVLPGLRQSMIAQFFYVGAQVCISSFFILYAENNAGLSLAKANLFLGFLLVCFMLGRYLGSFLMRRIEVTTLFFWFSVSAVLCCLIITCVGGMAGVISFLLIEFFMSIMFPTIFSMGVKDLGEKTNIASSYMVMMIVGGAFLPPVLGIIADRSNIATAFIVPLFCFLVVLRYAWIQRKKFVIQNTADKWKM